METDAVAKAYAQALFDTAQEAGQVKNLKETVTGLFEVWQSEPGLKSVLAHPGISVEDKQELIGKCFGFLDEELMKNFLGVLTEKHRIGHLGPILTAFQEIVDESEGIERAHVTSASPLDDASRGNLQKILSDKFGKTIILEEEIDQDLIGGLTVRVGDVVFDGSSQSALKGLASRLSDTRMNLDLWTEK